MQLKQDKNGMTLIEIVVVLLISTIIMGITGTMILSSMGYFSEEVVSQQDQEGLDDIAGYIRKELSYATDVRVSVSKPSEDAWHWISIENGKLYRDGSLLLEDDYYQNRRLVMSIQGFDNYRLDVHLQYQDTTSTAVATTRTSLELLNLKAEKEIDREYAPFSTSMDINETQKVYYITKGKIVEEKPEVEDSGTVEDQLNCLNNYNNRGTFIANTMYYTGDYLHDGIEHWWINVGASRVFSAAEEPGMTRTPIGWKKLSSDFDFSSSYEVGDIVLVKEGANKHYYQANRDMITYTPIPGSAGGGWSDFGLDKPDASPPVCRGLISQQKVVTVRNKLDNVDINKIIEYDNKIKYKLNDLVKVTNHTTNTIEYYLKVVDASGTPGSNASSGWQHLTRDFSDTSAYIKGDEVLYLRDGIASIKFKDTMIDARFDIETEIQTAENFGGSRYIELVKMSY